MQSIVKNIRRVFSSSSSGSGSITPGSEAVLGYKVYNGLFDQSGISNPVPIQLQNTIGSLSFTRSSAGIYNITSTGLFPSEDKIQVFFQNTDLDNFSYYAWIDVNTIQIINRTLIAGV